MIHCLNELFLPPQCSIEISSLGIELRDCYAACFPVSDFFADSQIKEGGSIPHLSRVWAVSAAIPPLYIVRTLAMVDGTSLSSWLSN